MSIKYDFTIKEGDTGPDLLVTLIDEDGDVVDISDYTSCKFRMADVYTNETKVDADATVVDASNGSVKYVWTTSDTDTPGEYRGEFYVDFDGTEKITFPNNGYISIMIYRSSA